MRIALLQLSSTKEIDENLLQIEALVKEALTTGATWILVPENAPFLGRDREKLPFAETLDGRQVTFFRDLARKHQIFLTLGSFAEISPDPNRTYNTQVHIDPQGEIKALYRKIHLFDVDVDESLSFKESASVYPGSDLVITSVTSPRGEEIKVGLTICYDLRFPGLYQKLRAAGAEILTVPSAFTLATGRAHWHALLKARAIENQAFLLAPNQWGHHYGTRHSFGQTAVYDPWGHALATAPDKIAMIVADLDFDYLREIRRTMPLFDHRRNGLS